MTRFLTRVALLVSLLAPAIIPAASAQAANCQFVLGFKTLHDQIPNVVGSCVVDEHHNPLNGDGLQETTGVNGKGGLLVWRKADNWTAYTDGYHTWINGPYGLQERLNVQRFCWEAGATAGACLGSAKPMSGSPPTVPPPNTIIPAPSLPPLPGAPGPWLFG